MVHAIYQGLQLLFPEMSRQFARPELRVFFRRSEVFQDAASLLQHFYGFECVASELRHEYQGVYLDLSRRYRDIDLDYPEEFAIGRESGALLYYLIRLSGPRTVLETGVANGHSSAIIVKALRKNSRGVLYSVDIDPDAGKLLTPEECALQELRIISRGHERSELQELLDSLDPIDLFFHDSDHTYDWQTIEYGLGAANLAPGGFLISDDVDKSFAFLDFCLSRNVTPVFLLDAWKVVGITKL